MGGWLGGEVGRRRRRGRRERGEWMWGEWVVGGGERGREREEGRGRGDGVDLNTVQVTYTVQLHSIVLKTVTSLISIRFKMLILAPRFLCGRLSHDSFQFDTQICSLDVCGKNL